MHKMISSFLLAWALGSSLCAADVPTQVQAPLPMKQVNGKDGAAMVLIPAGAFDMGSSEDVLTAWVHAHSRDRRAYFNNETPQHSVYLDGFYLYQNDVTVAQYRHFCTATKRAMPDPPGWGWLDDHPMVNVMFEDATAYAAWAGAMLPTEAQWEKAARGTDGRLFPWGNEFDVAKCHTSAGQNAPGQTSTCPVGSFPAGASPYGCLDMAGNVWQWCADWLADDYYTHAPSHNPTGPASKTFFCVLRGGSWYTRDAGLVRTTNRNGGLKVLRSDAIGFRCAVVVPARPRP